MRAGATLPVHDVFSFPAHIATKKTKASLAWGQNVSSHSDQGPEGPCRWAGRTGRGQGTFLSQRPHSPCPSGTPVSGDRVPSVGIPGSAPAADRSLPNRAGSTSKLRCLASELETDGRPETPQHIQRKSLLWRQVETWRALLSDD